MAQARPRRRGNGEGTAYFNEKLGLWTVQVSDSQAGKRRTAYAKTKDEALALKAKMVSDVAARRPATPARLTVGQLLTEWLEAEAIGTRRASGYERKVSAVRCHLRPALDKKRVATFGTRDVNDYIRERQATGCAPSSIRLHVHCLRRAFALAEEYGYAPRGSNPVVGAKLPPLPEREPRAMTLEEAQAFLAATRGDRWEALYVVALTTGLRISELCGLRWEDVDLEARTVTVRKKLLYVSRTLVDDEGPKRDKTPPTLPLTPRAVEVLKVHKRRQAEERLAYPDTWARPDLVFTTPEGKPQRGNIIGSHFTPKILAAAGLGHFTPHHLRSSAITLAGEHGEDLAVLQRLARHSSVATTMKYRAVRSREVERAVSRLGDLLTPTEDDPETPTGSALQ